MMSFSPPLQVIDDFGRLIYSEIDYAIEAASARRFVSLYGSIPNVTAPEIHPALSTRKVMSIIVIIVAVGNHD